MRDTTGKEDSIARSCTDLVITVFPVVTVDLAFEHVEQLLFVVMDVIWRLHTWIGEVVDQCERPSGVIPGGFEIHEGAERPDRRPIVVRQQVGLSPSVW